MATSKTFLDFLHPKDRKKIREEAKDKKFLDGDRVLQRGQINTVIYVIVKGKVRVVPKNHTRSLGAIILTTGDVIGEMSFIDKDRVSADVIAAGEVQVKMLDTDMVAEFILQDPFFFGRFYKALAKTLSFRLRGGDTRAASKQQEDWESFDFKSA